jgi:hypothetical protein
MRKFITVLTTGLLSLWASQSIQAGVIATWNFDNLGATLTSPTTLSASSYDSVRVSGNPSGVPASIATQPTSGGSLTRAAGQSGLGTDYALSINAANSVQNNGVLTLTVKALTALNGFSITYSIIANKKNGPDSQWAYSVDGGTFVNGTLQVKNADTSWHTYTIDFSAAGTLSANSYITFRNSLLPAGANDDQVAFDNISISAVPEPVNVALGIFAGVLAVGGVAGTRLVRGRIQQWRAAAVRWVDAV